jgi:hypothetical protein
MKDGEVFGPVRLLSLRDDIDTPVSRSLCGTGMLMWNRSLIDYLCKAMQRLERMSLNNERFPNGWERGL